MKNQKLILAFGELLIPILGFYWWQWDLHFIFLFYYLDVVASLVIYAVKIRKIELFRSGKWNLQHHFPAILKWYMSVIVGLIFFEIGLMFVYPELNLMNSLIDFLSYEELGIPQGIIILPLIALMNYQQYQLLFIQNGSYRILQINAIKKLGFYSFICFGIAGLIFLLFNLIVSIPDFYWIWLIAGSKVCFDLWIQPYIEHKIQEKRLP